MVEEAHKNSGNIPDWENLQEVWQDTPPVNTKNLARSARLVLWRMRINFALEILISVFGVILFGSFIDFVSIPASLLGVFGIAFSGVAFWAAIHIRRGAWDNPGEDTLSLVQLQVRRAHSMLLYIKLNSWFGYAGLILMPLGYWVLYERFGSLQHERIEVVHAVFGAMALFIIGFPLAMRPFVRKKKREVAELELIEKQLLEDESGGAVN